MGNTVEPITAPPKGATLPWLLGLVVSVVGDVFRLKRACIPMSLKYFLSQDSTVLPGLFFIMALLRGLNCMMDGFSLSNDMLKSMETYPS